jgi:hypothetical protein
MHSQITQQQTHNPVATFESVVKQLRQSLCSIGMQQQGPAPLLTQTCTARAYVTKAGSRQTELKTQLHNPEVSLKALQNLAFGLDLPQTLTRTDLLF